MPNGNGSSGTSEKKDEPKYCTAETFHGTCNSTLNSDGTCPYEAGQTDVVSTRVGAVSLEHEKRHLLNLGPNNCY
jgi:hypothetical protein